VKAFVMNTLKYLLVLILKLVKTQSEENIEFAVLKAIKGALNDHFVVYEPKIDLYYYGPNSEVLAEKILQEKPLEVSVRVFPLGTMVRCQLDAPSILLFDSAEHYFNKFENITWKSKDRVWYNHLVYAPKKDKLDVIEHFAAENLDVENQNYLKIVNETTVDIVTSCKFAPGKCNIVQFKTINQFSTDTMMWQNKTFFPERYQNFYNCSLKVGYQKESSSSASREILNLLAGHLNFHLLRVEVTSLRHTAEKFDLVEISTFQAIRDHESSKFSSSLFTDYVTFTVPDGEPYTQFEKMFLMFDKGTWICIGSTLVAALVVIQLISFMSIKVQNFIFGQENQTPTLSMVDIFLNGGQNKVPGTNFARYLLIVFVAWTLIIRTCYQSKLYKNLQQDMRRPKIQTVDELNEQNFTLLYTLEEANYFDEITNKK
jgi:hypothetical protein